MSGRLRIGMPFAWTCTLIAGKATVWPADLKGRLG